MMDKALTDAMNWLAAQPNTIFLGQSVGVEGTRLYHSLKDIPREQRIELPVAEDMQMGMSIGLSLEGYVPISVYPRWNFLILAANQLVNHLDRLPLYSSYRPKVIIRTAAGPNKPLNAGHQHSDDFSRAFELMFDTIEVVRLRKPEEVLPAYQKAYASEGSTVLVEG